MLRTSLLLSTFLAFSTPVFAEYPDKDIKLVVPWAKGGGTDMIARAFAKQGKKHLGVDIKVINKTGGQGIVGMSNSKVAKADGYTVGFITFGLSTYNIMGLSDLTYNDYHLLQMVNQSPVALTVSADSEFKTLADVMAYAKTHKGRMKVGHTGAGAANHLSAASLETEYGADFSFVPLEGDAPTKQALLDNRIEMAATGIEAVKREHDSGRLRVLAISGNTRHPSFPNTPTFAEAGFAVTTPILDWRGLAIPKDVSPERAAFLEEGFRNIFNDPEFIAYAEEAGIILSYKDTVDYESFLTRLEGALIPAVTAVGLKANQ